jgi:hypothetical protein
MTGQRFDHTSRGKDARDDLLPGNGGAYIKSNVCATRLWRAADITLADLLVPDF